jgi:hypothetical protein
VLAVAIAVVARLDSELEAAMVAAATTIGLGATLADPAASFTDTSPEPRPVRRARSLLPGLAASLGVWVGVTVGAAAAFDPTPAPGRWSTLVWVALAATQVAVGSLGARRSIHEPGLGPAAIVALGFFSPFFVPRLGEWLLPVPEHGDRWGLIAVGAVAVTMWAWRDPAVRSIRPRRRVRRLGGQLPVAARTRARVENEQ